MKPEPLPPIFCPHGWRKFQQSQQNMLRFFRRTGWKNHRRTLKWATANAYWIDRIYRDQAFRPVTITFSEHTAAK